MTKTAQPQPRRAIGLRRRWIVSSILPVITIMVLIAALVSIALGSNYYANARSALEPRPPPERTTSTPTP